MHTRTERKLLTDIAIVGAGTAGIAAAESLAAHSNWSPLLIDENPESVIRTRAAGAGRRRDRRNLFGPRHPIPGSTDDDSVLGAAKLVPSTTIKHLSADRTLEGHSPSGPVRIEAKVVVLANGFQANDLHRKTSKIHMPGIELSSKTGGPVVDSQLSTTLRGVFAIGDLPHPNFDPRIAARDGREVAGTIAEFLTTSPPKHPTYLRVQVDAQARWISPGLHCLHGTDRTHRHILIQADKLIRIPRISFLQNGIEIASCITMRTARPNQPIRLPMSMLDKADPNNGPITIKLHSAFESTSEWTPNILGEYIIPRAS